MRYLLCVFIPLLLTACSKPPGCADPKVVDLAKQIIEDNIIKKADPDGLKRMQVGLSLITEEGYNSDISKWACSGQVTLQTSPETLKVVNDEIDLIRNITHPNATQALALGLFRMAGKKVLTDEEERLTFALEARGWKPYTQEELKASINFSSQFEAGSKNLIVGVNSAAGLNQFPQLTRLGFARQQQAAAQASAQAAAQPASASASGGNDQAVKVQVAKAEMCGPEALCITDAGGTIYTGNAFAIPDVERTYIFEAAKRQGTVCLRGVSSDKTFDSVERC